MENAEEVMHSLEEFAKFKPKDIPKELDEYLGYVAKTGDPVFKWSIIKCLFREKLINVITDFYESTLTIELPPCPNVDVFNYERMKANLLERIDSFHGAPFTVQRISELLTNPRKEYNRADKFMRAIEKNILVVSTREPGRYAEADGETQGEPSFNGIPYRRDTIYDSLCNDLADPDSSSPSFEETEVKAKSETPPETEPKESSKAEEAKEEKEEKETVICSTVEEPKKAEPTTSCEAEEYLAESAFLNIDEAIEEITTSQKDEKSESEKPEKVKEEEKDLDLECKELEFSPVEEQPVECDTSNIDSETSSSSESKQEETSDDAGENEVSSCATPEEEPAQPQLTPPQPEDKEETQRESSVIHTTSEETEQMDVEESPTTTTETPQD